jgi:polar amino acid transport system substrate-binding protein
MLAGLIALALTSGAWATGEMAVVTEELPPYNMTENGKVTGVSTDIVKAVMKEADIDARIQVLPWARAYDQALNRPNVLIYSIVRTPERERLFQWIGSIAPMKWYLFSLAERPMHLQSLDDARGHQIATVNMDVGQRYLISKGFRPAVELQSTNRYETNYQMLKVDHVELWISNELNARYLVRKNGSDPDKELIRSLELPELDSEGGINMALSNGTAPAIVERFRRGLATIKANGTYDAIIRRWLDTTAEDGKGAH